MLADSQDTIRDVVDNTGATLKHLKYDGFGNVTSQTNSLLTLRFSYSGRELDAKTKLYYYRARYYDQGLGRFLSEDPNGFGAGDLNLFSYVGNSPTNFTDPTGKARRTFDGGTFGLSCNIIDRGVGPLVAEARWFFTSTPDRLVALDVIVSFSNGDTYDYLIVVNRVYTYEGVVSTPNSNVQWAEIYGTALGESYSKRSPWPNLRADCILRRKYPREPQSRSCPADSTIA
jgi:RHS repeat-associated protein